MAINISKVENGFYISQQIEKPKFKITRFIAKDEVAVIERVEKLLENETYKKKEE